MRKIFYLSFFSLANFKTIDKKNLINDEYLPRIIGNGSFADITLRTLRQQDASIINVAVKVNKKLFIIKIYFFLKKPFSLSNRN